MRKFFFFITALVLLSTWSLPHGSSVLAKVDDEIVSNPATAEGSASSETETSAEGESTATAPAIKLHYTPREANLGKNGFNINIIKIKGMEAIPGKIIPFFTGVVVLIAILIFMLGAGFWILSAGNDSLVQRGKDMMTYSLIGLLLVLGAYVITTLFQTLLYILGT